MNKPEIKTLKELKKTNYKSESIKEELGPYSSIILKGSGALPSLLDIF